MAASVQLPAISQAPVAREFPKVWLHRKDMSRWAKLDVPSLKLASQLDTDHWAKLKGKHIEFVTHVSYGFPPKPAKQSGHSHPQSAGLSSAFQKYYYNKSQHREDLLKKSFTMYQQGKPVEKEASLRANKQHRPQVQRRPSVYNQRAKEGFKFWLEDDPMINRVSFCSKYTFGSKSTFHGLGNAPRN